MNTTQLTPAPNYIQEKLPENILKVSPLLKDLSDTIKSVVEGVGGFISGGSRLIGDVANFFFKGAGDAFYGFSDSIDSAIQAFKKFAESTNNFIEKLEQIIHGIMMPWIMPDYAEKWVRISDHMYNISEILGPEALRAPGAKEWTGKAAESYRMIAAKYVAAAEFASEIAMEHSTLLEESATAAQNFYASALGFLTSIIDGILEAIGSLSIFNIAGVILNLLANGENIAKHIIDVVKNLLAFIDDQTTAFIDIKARLQGASYHFPDGFWPPAGD